MDPPLDCAAASLLLIPLRLKLDQARDHCALGLPIVYCEAVTLADADKPPRLHHGRCAVDAELRCSGFDFDKSRKLVRRYLYTAAWADQHVDDRDRHRPGLGRLEQ